MAEHFNIVNLAMAMGFSEDELILYGHKIAKVRIKAVQRLERQGEGKLILITGMTPTPAGEGKTTTAIGLGDALRLLGKKVSVALREPSVALAFGQKGSGTGGGLARIVPSDQINLHFTGDFHAIETAHNFLSAVVDDYLYRADSPVLVPDEVVWKRATGVNDRVLRQVVVGIGGRENGITRQERFEAVACSEIMGILCLSKDYRDLKSRLSRVVIGYTKDKKLVTVGEIGVVEQLAIILSTALQPNIIQTYGGTPAFVHGGPYANIALGCNTILGTKMALKTSDYAITEAGGATDTGGEKFFNIKCRALNLKPSAAIIVSSIRALKRQGGVKEELAGENIQAVERGFDNLRKHVRIIRSFGIPPIIALNRFETDSRAEIETVLRLCNKNDVTAAVSEVWSKGANGGLELGRALLEVIDGAEPPVLNLTYPDNISLKEKIFIVATEIYGAKSVIISKLANEKLFKYENHGYGHLPICIVKPHTSFVEGTFEVADVSLASGAGYINAFTKDVIALPGLPANWSTRRVFLNDDGSIEGLS